MDALHEAYPDYQLAVSERLYHWLKEVIAGARERRQPRRSVRRVRRHRRFTEYSAPSRELSGGSGWAWMAAMAAKSLAEDLPGDPAGLLHVVLVVEDEQAANPDHLAAYVGLFRGDGMRRLPWACSGKAPLTSPEKKRPGGGPGPNPLSVSKVGDLPIV